MRLFREPRMRGVEAVGHHLESSGQDAVEVPGGIG